MSTFFGDLVCHSLQNCGMGSDRRSNVDHQSNESFGHHYTKDDLQIAHRYLRSCSGVDRSATRNRMFHLRSHKQSHTHTLTRDWHRVSLSPTISLVWPTFGGSMCKGVTSIPPGSTFTFDVCCDPPRTPGNQQTLSRLAGACARANVTRNRA